MKEKIFNLLTKAVTNLSVNKTLVTALLDWLLARILKPTYEMLVRKLATLYKKIRGKMVVNKIEKAKKEGNESDYNDSIDNL